MRKLNSSFTWLVVIFIVIICYIVYTIVSPSIESFQEYKKCPYRWNGGDPSGAHQGSCWCGKLDNYCMCTPNLAVEAIVEYNPDFGVDGPEKECNLCKIVLVIRRDSPGKSRVYAIPGGFVNLGESTEMAVIRELKEETNLSIAEERLQQFKMFSDVMKDHRRQTATLVYRYLTNDLSNLRSGDDAKDLVQIELREVMKLNLAFDHRKVLMEYLQRYHPTIWKNMNKNTSIDLNDNKKIDHEHAIPRHHMQE